MIKIIDSTSDCSILIHFYLNLAAFKYNLFNNYHLLESKLNNI